MTRTSRSQTLRSAGPAPSVPTMGVREFLRGGIYDASEPITVLSNNTELGTWYPRGQGAAVYYSASPSATSLSFTTSNALSSTTTTTSSSIDVDGIRDAVAQLHAYLNPEKEKNG